MLFGQVKKGALQFAPRVYEAPFRLVGTPQKKASASIKVLQMAWPGRGVGVDLGSPLVSSQLRM